MNFLLQNDDVMLIEKRAILHMAALRDYNIKYASLQDIYNGVIPEGHYTPVGTVEFTKAYAKILGVTIERVPSYPQELEYFLNRIIRLDSFSGTMNHEFVKPVETKLFTGGLKKDLVDADDIPHNTTVWASEPVTFVSEWRYYILNNEIVGCGRYDDNENDDGISEHIVSAAVGAMVELNIMGYSLDFGRMSNGLTALVEVNDGWALGYYKGTCNTEYYAKLINARWEQILC